MSATTNSTLEKYQALQDALANRRERRLDRVTSLQAQAALVDSLARSVDVLASHGYREGADQVAAMLVATATDRSAG